MKKLLITTRSHHPLFRYDLRMKLSTLFILAALFSMKANDGYGQNAKVTVNMTNVSVKQFIDEVEDKEGFEFVYALEDVDLERKITINARKMAISTILYQVFKDTKTDFNINGNRVYLIKRANIHTRGEQKIKTLKNPQSFVNGTVMDKQGTPLPGASIIEKGTTNGVQTDFDGNFSLEIGNKDAILVVSYIGFITKEINVNGRVQLNIALDEDAAELDEVVLVGYGSQKKKEITSSVVSVKSEDFNKGNVSDPVRLLQGKVAGLQVGRAGGNPNQPYTVRLRGINSLGGDSSPLVVIDGILGGSLEALDPNDIESIEVLKDASAAAIYGTRASAGVLIVTTKSGNGAISKPKLTLTSQASFETISNTPEIASAAYYRELGGQDLGATTDWLDQVSRTGVSEIYNVSYGGRTENGLSYQASLNYRDNNGVIVNSTEFNQLNGRINISQRLFDDKLTLTTILASTSRSEDQGFQQSLTQALFYNPTAPVYNPDGSFFETQDQDRYNPVAINEQNVRDRKLNQSVYTFGADYRILTNLVLSGIFTQQRSSELIGEYSKRNALFGGGLVNGWARRATVDRDYRQMDWTLGYNDNFGDLNYAITLGQSYNYDNFQSAVASNTDFITDEFSYNNLAAGQGINKNGVVSAEGNTAQPQNFVGSNQRESISNAYFLRTNFNYNDAAFLSATYRREGSSRFGSNNRWGNFWALSGGTDLKNIFDLPVDQLKIRVGYGVTGTLPNVFNGYLGTLRLTSGGFANGQFISAVTPATDANPDLKWEEKAELNIGLDFAFLNRRLSGSLDFFKRNTTDLLNVVDVPSPPNAVSQQLRNVGELESKGVELQLSYRVIDKEDFEWSVDANFSTAKTKLIEFNPDSEQTTIRSRGLSGAVAIGNIRPVWTIEGEEIGQIYAQPFVRYAENGDPIVLLKDGSEAVFDPSQFLDEAVNVADALPDAFVGLTNSFRYKNFDLNIFLRGVFGHHLVNETRAAYENTSGIAIRNVVITEGEFDQSVVVPHFSTRYVENASFVRIDNMTLGYTLPEFKNAPVNSMRIFINGQNLATFTSYKGADPDVRYFDPAYNGEGRRGNSFGGDALFPGIDRYITFLPTRTISLGFNLEF